VCFNPPPIFYRGLAAGHCVLQEVWSEDAYVITKGSPIFAVAELTDDLESQSVVGQVQS
jgi:hypothetical protein